MLKAVARVALIPIALGAAPVSAFECTPSCTLEDSENPCQELFLTLRVNDTYNMPVDAEPYIVENDKYWVPARVFDKIGLQPPQQQDTACSTKYYQLDGHPKSELAINKRSLSGNINIPAQYFSRTQYTKRDFTTYKPDPSDPGIVMQYDFTFAHDIDRLRSGGFVSFEAFWGEGYGSTSFSVFDIFDQPDVIRQQSWWRWDYQDGSTFLIGDTSIGRSRIFRGSALYGGLSYSSTNISRAGLIGYPSLTFEGVAEVQSTVELFIDDISRSLVTVPPGPFEIDHQTYITGDGKVTILVTDALGRQRVVESEFYTDTELLRPGLSDFSASIGWQRKDFGIKDFSYGELFFSSDGALGLTDYLTGFAELEATKEHVAAGGSLVWLAAPRLKLKGALASSYHDVRGSGYLGRVQVTTGWKDGTNIGGRLEHYSRDFFRLGQSVNGSSPKLLAAASVGFSPYQSSYITAGYAESRSYEDDRSRSVTANWTTPIDDATFTLQYNRNLEVDKAWSVNMTLSWDWGITDHNASFGYSPNGRRYGYNYSFSPDDEDYAVAWGNGWTDEPNSFASNLSFSSSNETNAMGLSIGFREGSSELPIRGDFNGSIGVIKGRVLDAGNISRGVVLVHVPGFPGVRVYHGGLAGRTDENGYLAIPVLTAFKPVTIKLEAADLPVGATIDSLTKSVTPGFRSGFYMLFEPRFEKHATGVVTFNGKHIRSGTSLINNSTGAEYLVGLDGEVYFENLEDTVKVTATLDNKRKCDIVLVYPTKSTDPLPDLGVLKCKLVAK